LYQSPNNIDRAELFTKEESILKKLRFRRLFTQSAIAAVASSYGDFPAFSAFTFPTGIHLFDIGSGAILGALFAFNACSLLIGFRWLDILLKMRGLSFLVYSLSLRIYKFFIVMYSTAIFLPMLIKGHRVLIAFLLAAGYCFYAYMTFRGESAHISTTEDLYLKRIWNICRGFFKRHQPLTSDNEPGILLISVQVLVALGIMISGGICLVGTSRELSLSWGMNRFCRDATYVPVVLNAESLTA
jgi:hypothetical protein